MASSSTKASAPRKPKAKPKQDGNRQTSLFDSFLKRNPATSLPAGPSLPPEATSEPTNVHSTETVSTERVTEYLRLTSLEPTPDPALQTFSAVDVPEVTVPPPAESSAVVEIEDSPIEERPPPLPNSQGSVHDPIVIGSSPEKPRSREATVRPPINPFFAPRTAKNKIDVQLPKPTSTSKRSYDAPYPTAESQHVRGPQNIFYAISKASKRPRTLSESRSDGATSFPSPDLAHVVSPSAWNEKMSRQVSPNILRCHISNISDVSEVTTPSQKLWTEKWRPTRAEQVLGNRENAIYLRDWLHALELQLGSASALTQNSGTRTSLGAKETKKTKEVNKKRPRVIRAVEKKKKKRRTEWDEADDWIVDDEYHSDDPILDSEAYDGLDFVPPTPEPDCNTVPPSGVSPESVGGRLEFKARAFDSLTNTILLAGPSGVGKTATVYACAEELGWEVFEVYPGIGRRNGAGVESLVGEVGKNHHVKSKSSGTGKQSNSSVGFFGRIQPSERGMSPEKTSETAPTVVLPEAEPAPNARQSLVLLEEVDILFKDDTGFWPSVIEFIKSCKRPVICTCNDISSVPTEDLPLQTILAFKPCATSEAASYLRSACTSEGYNIDIESLRQLYESPPPSFPTSSPSDSPEIIPYQDLRRTIYHLQLQCSTLYSEAQSFDILLPQTDVLDTTFNRSWANLEPSQKIVSRDHEHSVHATLHTTSARNLAANHADLISFTDSYLLPYSLDTSETRFRKTLTVHGYSSSADDEVDCQHALSSGDSWFPLGSFQDEDGDMACTALLLSRGILEKGYLTGSTSIDGSIDRFGTSAMFRARMGYQQHISTALENVIPWMMLTTRRSDVYADYVPYIREIISAEDIQEEQELLKEKPGRSTRNSARSRYERSIEIRPEQRAALSVTAFGRTL